MQTNNLLDHTYYESTAMRNQNNITLMLFFFFFNFQCSATLRAPSRYPCPASNTLWH